MSIDQLFACHTERQLSLWIAHVLNEEETTSRDQWYLIQIAAEIRRWKMKNPRSVTLEDLHLFKDDRDNVVRDQDPQTNVVRDQTSSPSGYGLTEAQKQARVNKSKVYWGMVLAQPPAPVPPSSAHGQQRKAPPHPRFRR